LAPIRIAGDCVTEYIVYSVQRREEWQKLAIVAWLSLAAVLCRRFRTGDP